MNVTIFPTGKGGVASAVNYLLSDKDHEGKKRSIPPEILSGDPNTFEAIANATRRLHKYTSGVVAFRDGESVTPEQINTVIETFRSTFLPGLELDKNFADFWVMHREKGNVELHFLVANTELVSTQQLNIHPPGAKNIAFFNAFSAVMNDSFGFAQVVPDPLKISLKPFEAKSPTGKKDKKAKGDFATVLHSEIVGGFITNRNQLIGYLTRNGIDVAKIGSDFLTVRLPGQQKNTRLKGPLFCKDSDYAELVAQHHQSKIPKYLTQQEAQEQKDKLVAGIEARLAFNVRRYLTPKPRAVRAQQLVSMPFMEPDRTRPKAVQPPPKRIADHLNDHLRSLKEHAAPKPPVSTADLPHQVARRQTDQEQAALLPSIGNAALGSLEAQIGSLSLQYHSLLLLLAGAKGKRATLLKSQIMALEQKLSALNLELEKKKAQTPEVKLPDI
ncbi:relaxase family protein [Delftia lacustris]